MIIRKASCKLKFCTLTSDVMKDFLQKYSWYACFVHSCFPNWIFDNSIATTLQRLVVLSFACWLPRDLLVFLSCLTDNLYHSSDLREIQSATFVSVLCFLTKRDAGLVRPGASSVFLSFCLIYSFSKRPFDLFTPPSPGLTWSCVEPLIVCVSCLSRVVFIFVWSCSSQAGWNSLFVLVVFVIVTSRQVAVTN